MDHVAIIALDGLVYASWLFLVSAGLTFVYGVLRILNVAHGSLYALGAYTAASVAGAYLSTGFSPVLGYVALLAAALLVGAIMGPLLERIFLRRAYGQEEVVVLLLTFAIFLILEDVMKLVWGVNPFFVNQPYVFLGQVNLAGISYARYPFLLVAIAIAAGGLLWALVNRTRFGKLLIAVIADREVSAAMGINVPRINTIAFTLGATFAALGGAFTAPMISVAPGMSAEVIVLSFAVTVIGGLGNVGGAAIGALWVGLLRAGAVHLAPELDLFVIYALMALILLIRPQGLFGGVELRRV
jgi:branched-chain amino acid transport system permease protein